MGTRLLREWIVRPLTQVTAIQLRQEAVKEIGPSSWNSHDDS